MNKNSEILNVELVVLGRIKHFAESASHFTFHYLHFHNLHHSSSTLINPLTDLVRISNTS